MHEAQEDMRAALARLLALQSERQELQSWQRAARKVQAWLFLSPLWPVLVGMTSVCARALCVHARARALLWMRVDWIIAPFAMVGKIEPVLHRD